MIRKLMLIWILNACYMTCMAQDYKYAVPDYTPAASNLEARENFKDNKFGMFIHWGIYSVLADGEWVMHNKKIPYHDYQKLARFFNPQQFNAKEWVQLTKDAGMKYITITSRHHDGFSMFYTQASGYNIIDATPFKRDPLMELAKECEKEGIGLHFYYSLLDWGRKDYGFGKSIVNGAPVDTDWNAYISFMKTQLTELITRYPNVKAIWFDGHWERPDADWNYKEIYELIHQLNPAILVGNNHHRTPIPGEDIQMFEKDLPGENRTGYRKNARIADMPLETCETLNNSWGFNVNDRNYKTSRQIIHLLVNAAARNANLLLNVGPMPDGTIQQEFRDTLAAVGKWLKQNNESIYETRGNIIAPQLWGVVTAKNNALFAHILNKPATNYIFLPGIAPKIKSVSNLHSSKTLRFKQQPEGVFIYLEHVEWDDTDTIIELKF